MKITIKGLRWYIVSLVALTTALNYFDRQTLALLAGTLEKVLGISTIQYSYMTAAFLTSYTVMYAVSGRLIDRLGTRRGLAIFVAGWSVADALHALARTALQFSMCRFLLGAMEPANFPAGVKAVSEWFPMRQRALAVGIFNSGTAIGAAIAAPVVAWITLHFGWRYAFVTGSALSMVWAILWLLVYRLPRQHPWLGAGELRLIEEHAGMAAAPPPVPVRRILRMREARGCILARMLTDPISYFFAFWVPTFLQQERGFDLAAIGRYYWIPYVALAVGNVAGGAVPGWLIRGGWSVDRARKSVMFSASCLIPACFVLITRVPSPAWAVALISVAMFCHAAWANMVLPAEVFPKHVVGTVSGLGGAFGSLVGAVTMLLIGRTVALASFTPIFIIYAALPVTAWVIVCVLVPQLGRVRDLGA
jgi:ACS family hexuronate transporter-like MFS transporter